MKCEGCGRLLIQDDYSRLCRVCSEFDNYRVIGKQPLETPIQDFMESRLPNKIQTSFSGGKQPEELNPCSCKDLSDGGIRQGWLSDNSYHIVCINCDKNVSGETMGEATKQWNQ